MLLACCLIAFAFSWHSQTIEADVRKQPHNDSRQAVAVDLVTKILENGQMEGGCRAACICICAGVEQHAYVDHQPDPQPDPSR